MMNFRHKGGSMDQQERMTEIQCQREERQAIKDAARRTEEEDRNLLWQTNTMTVINLEKKVGQTRKLTQSTGEESRELRQGSGQPPSHCRKTGMATETESRQPGEKKGGKYRDGTVCSVQRVK